MFYSKLYRRHLLDMHIDDWNEEFLSRFSPEEYVNNLQKANVNYAMIYLQSHAGLCYWPTKTGHIHKRFEAQPDLIRRVVDGCHAKGIKVIGYYSLIYNTREHDAHPDWRMLQSNGKSRRENGAEGEDLAFASTKQARYGFCCPSNMDYRQFVYDQIDEMLQYFDVDALFFDMPFWSHTCHCQHCQKAFGGDPSEDRNDRKTVEFKAKMMGQFIQSVTDHVKLRRPDMPVEHNYANAIASNTATCCLEEVLAACDYVGGDLYGDLYNHSFACKFYKNATKNAPFEQMFSRCKPALRMHTLTKSPDQMKAALSSTMQHHGATLVIDAIDPVGTMDARLYDQIGELFRFQEKYEPWFTGEMVEQVGLYYGLRSRPFGQKITSLSCCANAGRTLIRNHIPFGVTGCFHDYGKYPILVAPMLSAMEDKDNENLISYVENGGTLYLSGGGNAALIEKLTGNRILENSREENVYIAPVEGREALFFGFNRKYPLPFETPAALAEAGHGEVLATLTFPYTKPDDVRFASIHSNPPGVASSYPAVTVNRYGKGMVIWSALPIEDMMWEEYRQIFLNLLFLEGRPNWFFASDAPRTVELTAFRHPGSVTVSAVSLDEEYTSTPVAPFSVSVDCLAKAVRLLPHGEEIPFQVENGRTVFTTRQMHIFDMYELIL